ncbi:hypothetical protein TWF481_002734 [Arthrobotrys musiformis]|uniref:Secreted protein n=1 Tax=Arthrobotrys musiformis TaxID=47236 RepID=A0AAV9VT14_9PEZI
MRELILVSSLSGRGISDVLDALVVETIIVSFVSVLDDPAWAVPAVELKSPGATSATRSISTSTVTAPAVTFLHHLSGHSGQRTLPLELEFELELFLLSFQPRSFWPR